MGDSPTGKGGKKLTGKKINMHAYVTPETYEELRKYADPDDGDRWEAALLRRIIREWISGQQPQRRTFDNSTEPETEEQHGAGQGKPDPLAKTPSTRRHRKAG